MCSKKLLKVTIVVKCQHRGREEGVVKMGKSLSALSQTQQIGHRQSQHPENQAKKPRLPNPNQTPRPTNHLFFKEHFLILDALVALFINHLAFNLPCTP